MFKIARCLNLVKNLMSPSANKLSGASQNLHQYPLGLTAKNAVLVSLFTFIHVFPAFLHCGCAQVIMREDMCVYVCAHVHVKSGSSQLCHTFSEHQYNVNKNAEGER